MRSQIAQNESGPLASLRQASTDKLKEQLGYLTEQERMERRSVEASVARNQQDQAGISFGKLKEESLTRQEKLEKALASANAIADKAGISQADRKGVLDDIREKYKAPKGAKGRDTSRTEARAGLQEQLDQVRAFVAQEADVYKSREDELRRQRAADLIGDTEYLAGLTSAEGSYLAALVKARDEEAADIAKRRSATTDKGVRSQLSDEATKSAERYANAIRDTTRQVTSSYLEADAKAAEYARTMVVANQRATADLIQDSSARATALAAIDAAEDQRRVIS